MSEMVTIKVGQTWRSRDYRAGEEAKAKRVTVTNFCTIEQVLPCRGVIYLDAGRIVVTSSQMFVSRFELVEDDVDAEAA